MLNFKKFEYRLPDSPNKRNNCMVEEPSDVKQLSQTMSIKLGYEITEVWENGV
jgi:hypothetical protein